jgi:L-threonylcarbamoyladenylate synthase
MRACLFPAPAGKRFSPGTAARTTIWAMDHSQQIPAAVALLRRGGVIAYPTEAVWGLGCDPANQAAVMRLLQIKQRPVEKGMILVAADLEQLRPWLDLDALPADRLAQVLASWPGPNTWIMPAAGSAPPWITGSHRGIAVRVSAHPGVVALCQAFGGSIVSTSANLSSEPPARSREGLDGRLLALIDGLVDGPTGGLANPTAIRNALDGSLLRS